MDEHAKIFHHEGHKGLKRVSELTAERAENAEICIFSAVSAFSAVSVRNSATCSKVLPSGTLAFLGFTRLRPGRTGRLRPRPSTPARLPPVGPALGPRSIARRKSVSARTLPLLRRRWSNPIDG